MFVPLHGQTSLGISPDQVVAVIASINSPSIAVSGEGTEPAKAYIVGLQLPNGSFTVAIYLHMLHSNTPMIYRPEPLSFGLDHYPNAEAEAIQFVESMGFMLENMNFRAQPPQEVARLVEMLPFFHELEPVAQGTVMGADEEIPAAVGSVVVDGAAPTGGVRLDDAEAEAIGRLLGSF
jgi:hypothetical protein